MRTGGKLHRNDQYNEALQAFRLVIAICKDSDDQRALASGLNCLGRLYQDINDLKEAQKAFQQQIEIGRSLNDLKQQHYGFQCLGKLLLQSNQIDKALQEFLNSVLIATTLNDKNSFYRISYYLEKFLEKQNTLEEFLQAFQTQIRISEESQEQEKVDVLLSLFRSCLQRQDRLEEARLKLQMQAENKENFTSKRSIAIILVYLGQSFKNRSDTTPALEIFQSVVKLAEVIEDHKLQAKGLNNLGDLYLGREELEEAEQSLQQSVDISIKFNDDQKQLSVGLQSLGKLRLRQNQVTRALPLFLLGIELSGEKRSFDNAFHHLKNCLQEKNGLEKLREVFQAQIKVARTVSNQKQIAIAYHLFSRVLQSQGVLKSALKIIEYSIKISEALDEQQLKILRFEHYGDLLQQLERKEDAIEAFQRVIDLSIAFGDKYLLLNGLYKKGNLLKTQGSKTAIAEAVSLFQRQIEIGRTLPKRPRVLSTQIVLGSLLLRQQKPLEALKALKEAVYHEAIKDKIPSLRLLKSVGDFLLNKEMLDEAQQAYQLIVKISEIIGNQKELLIGLHYSGVVFQRKGNYEKAYITLKREIEISEDISNRKYLQQRLKSLSEGILNQFDKTTQALQEIINEINEKPLGISEFEYDLLGNSLEREGQVRVALQGFQRVLEVNEVLRSKQPIFPSTTLTDYDFVKMQDRFEQVTSLLRLIFNAAESYNEELQAVVCYLAGQVQRVWDQLVQKRKRELGTKDMAGQYSEQAQDAFHYFNGCINKLLNDQESNNQEILAKAYAEKGRICLSYGCLEEAVKNLIKSYKIHEKLSNVNALELVVSDLVYALVVGNRYQDALNYCQQAHTLSPQSKDLTYLYNSLKSRKIFREGIITVKRFNSKHRYQGYIQPDDGEGYIFFGENFTISDCWTQLDKNVCVEVIAMRLADTLYARNIRVID